MTGFFSEITPHHWSILSVLVATIAAHFVTGIALSRFEKITLSTSNIWDDALLAAVRKPLPVLIWLSGLFIATYLHYSLREQALPALIAHARNISLSLCVSWFLFALIRHAAQGVEVQQFKQGLEVDLTTIHGISRVARIGVVVLSGLFIIQSLGFSISGMLAFGGVGGIAIGFAAKDILANLLGGFLLHLDRPFNLGESIRSPDKQIEGQVEYIGWRQTVLRSKNMEMIYVPNSLFSSIVLVNLSRRSHRRIEEIIGLRYEDASKIEAICTDVRNMLISRSDIDVSRDVIVAFNNYGESSLNLSINAFTLTTKAAEFSDTKQSVLLAVGEIVLRHGADFAFPTRTLQIENSVDVLKSAAE
jgi:MscS family membrane protein